MVENIEEYWLMHDHAWMNEILVFLSSLAQHMINLSSRIGIFVMKLVFSRTITADHA